MTTKAKKKITLEIKRLIKAPRAKVFDAWTTPELIVKWFGPATCRALSAKVDLRVGGEYRIRTHNDAYGEMEVYGTYREIKRPTRLAFTWKWADSEMEDGETFVTVDFAEADGATEVRLRHEGFTSMDSRDKHNHGWNGCFDKLEKLLGESSDCKSMATGEFCWNELVTKDLKGAGKFYSQLFSWKAEKFPGEGVDYTLFKQGEKGIGGMMECQDKNVPPFWLAYVSVENVDASAKRVTQLGGKIVKAPFDVPTVGRLAIFQDPQGAAFAAIQPLKK